MEGRDSVLNLGNWSPVCPSFLNKKFPKTVKAVHLKKNK